MNQRFGDTVRVIFNAVYSNGVALFSNLAVAGDAELKEKRPGSNMRVVTLRFVAPASQAESIAHAFRTGDCEIVIGGVQALA